MSRFEERLENHSVWSRIDQLKDLVDAAEKAIENQDLGESHRLEIRRLIDVLRYLNKSLSAADPYLVSEGALNSIDGQLEHAVNHLRSYENNPQLGQLQNANGRMDNVLHSIPSLHVPKTEADVSDIRERLTGFRISAGQLISNLEDEVEQAQKQVADLSKVVEAETQEAESTLNEQVNQIKQQAASQREELAADLREELQQIKSGIQAHEEKLTGIREDFQSEVTEFKQQFSEIQESRRQSFEENQKERRNQFEEAIAKIETEGEEFVDRMSEYEQKVIDLMGVVGATGLTGGFKKEAEHERWQANFWRAVAIVAMGGIIWVAAWMTETTITAEVFEIGRFAAKAFLTGAIGVVAGYAVNQSSKHRQIERRTKQLELELASIDPYLSALPEEKQAEIKADLIGRWFGRLPESREGEEITKENLFDTVIDLAKWGVKKGS